MGGMEMDGLDWLVGGIPLEVYLIPGAGTAFGGRSKIGFSRYLRIVMALLKVFSIVVGKWACGFCMGCSNIGMASHS